MDDKLNKQKRTSGSEKLNRPSESKTPKRSFRDSFKDAARGIAVGIVEERNMKIHMLAVVLVLIFGIIFRLSLAEWGICLCFLALIPALELVNTAIESVVDLVTEEYHPLAKRAKDVAAGAVLWASVIAAVAGAMIFLPKLLGIPVS